MGAGILVFGAFGAAEVYEVRGDGGSEAVFTRHLGLQGSQGERADDRTQPLAPLGLGLGVQVERVEDEHLFAVFNLIPSRHHVSVHDVVVYSTDRRSSVSGGRGRRRR